MNKLFSKIAALSVGLAMAVGVGVAVGHEAVREVRAENTPTPITDLVTGDTVVIVGQSGDKTYAMTNNNGTASAPVASEITVTTTSDIADNLKWEIEVSGTSYKFKVPNSTNYLYTTATNNGVRVGTNTNSSFTIDSGYLKNSATSRYVGIYNSQDWRCYTTINNNIKDQTFTFYKVTETSLPSLVIKNSSGETGPFINLSSKSLGGFMFYAYDDESTQKAVAFSISDSNVATLQDNEDGSCCVYPKKPRTVSLTAELEGYKTASASLTFVYPYEHSGTAEDPFTVEEALAKANEIGTVGNVGQGPWVTRGIISRVTSAPAATFWNATYYISDDGSQTNELQVYRGFYIDNVKFDETTAALLTAGKIATVYGNLTGSYGCEYTQGNYLLALEEQSTGDVDVVFEPETSIEISDTGTFTATSETAGVVFTWAVDKPEVLSVNETTGEYEALAYGSAKVTVTATAGDKTGSTYAVIVVNGSSLNFLDVTDAIDIASKLESGKTTEYYVCFAGYVREFATSEKDGKPRAFDIQNEKQDASIMVYTNIDPYEAFVDGLQLGSLVRVKANIQNYNGTYELVSPVRLYTEYVAMTFAYELLDETDKVCKDYDDVTNNHDAIEAIWTAMKPKYEALNDTQKNRLVNPSLYGVGETIVNAMERYDYLTGKYDLENFITGRTPVVFSNVNSQFSENNNSSTIIIVIASISVLSFGLALALRKKRTK